MAAVLFCPGFLSESRITRIARMGGMARALLFLCPVATGTCPAVRGDGLADYPSDMHR